jgi:hypothetical protein
MPYVLNEKRNKITPVIHGESGRVEMKSIDCAGDLNYAFTKLAIDYFTRKGLSYQTINDIVGAFVCAKDEFQRRVVGPYEDSKVKDNGDVYPNTVTPKYPTQKEFNGS